MRNIICGCCVMSLLWVQMKDELQIVNEVREKAARFNSDPRTSVPCLDCGRAIPRDKVKGRDYLLHARCVPRFKARMRADGRDPGTVLQRAFRDVFFMARGFDYRGRTFQDNLPPLPNAEALLLGLTGVMHQTRLDAYLMGENPALFDGCKAAFQGEWVVKAS